MSRESATPTAQQPIWDFFQNEGSDAFRGSGTRLRHLASRARALVRATPGARGDVLDVGVGDGAFVGAALGHGLRAHAVDPDARAVERLGERIGERARVGTADAIPFPAESFDVVVLSEVLEHLDDAILAGTLDEVVRVLRPGGWFLGTVPAREELGANLAVCPRCEHRFHRWGHVRAFSAESLTSLLATRFEPQAVRERPFPSWSTLNWSGRVRGALKLVLARAGLHRGGETLVFEARRGGG